MKLVLKSQGQVIAEKQIQFLPTMTEKIAFRNEYLSEGGLVEVVFTSKAEELAAIEAKF